MVDTPSATGKLPVAIIGAGRVGSALARALHTAGYPVTAIWSRTPAHAAELAARLGAAVTPLEKTPQAAALTLITVPDDHVAQIAARIAGSWRADQMAIHCSGALPAGVLAPIAEYGALIGGFHPLVAISERDQALPPDVTFAVEAAEPLRTILRQMAYDLHGRAFDLEPGARPLYHAAAVLASNYTVVLTALAAELMERAGIKGVEALGSIMPLLRSTLTNLENAGLPRALTGPLVRGDAGTVFEHLAALDVTAPDIAQVYRTLGLAALPLVEARGTLEPAAIAKLEDAIRGILLDQPNLPHAMPPRHEIAANSR
jgi:predicted short-subunit dehydrogenase-like oxidoreductase (DUF2520 family)